MSNESTTQSQGTKDQSLVNILRTAITMYVRNAAHTLSPSEKDFITEALTILVQDIVKKYKVGAAEHGGNFFARDHDAEAYNEILDLTNYHFAKMLGHKYKTERHVELMKEQISL